MKMVILESLKGNAPLVEKVYQKSNNKKEAIKKQSFKDATTTWNSQKGRSTFGYNPSGRLSSEGTFSIFSTGRYSIPKADARADLLSTASKCPSTIDMTGSPLLKKSIPKKQVSGYSAAKKKNFVGK